MDGIGTAAESAVEQSVENGENGAVLEEPGLPGEEDVTDGSVDWYEMDWENVDNGVLESEMPKCPETPCSAASRCEDNTPEQTDDETYEIVEE